MEGEVKKVRERQARVQGIQEQPIFHNMQHNHQPESDRRRLSLENLPGLYNMSCTQLLALANNTVHTSSSVGAASSSSLSSQYSTDSWINSWKVESNPRILNPGSYLGIDTGISGERTIQAPQYDVSTPQKFICDLNLTPEEMVSTSTQSTEPEFPPIILDTPGKRLAEADQEPKDFINKSFLETGSPAGAKKRKRRSDAEKAQLKTPTLKRKKIRPKVVREGKTNKASSKAGTRKSSVAAATATKLYEESSYVRPKRSSKRSLRMDFDFQDEGNLYCGFDFPSEGHTGGEEPTYSTAGLFGNIPKRRRQGRTNSITRKERINPSSEQGNGYLSSMLSLVNTGPATSLESEEDLPSDSYILQGLGRKRSSIVTRPRNFRSLKKLLQSIVPINCERKIHKLPCRLPDLKAIVSKMQSKVSKKKRSQRDPIASQINARILDLQWRRQNPIGTSLAEIWERSLTMDAITKLFDELNINREGRRLPHNRETALILYKDAYKEQQALVKYSKKQQQPKVELDLETIKMWKLLMVGIDIDGVDGSDEEKRKWWEEERNVFHGRANSFIARMRKVQGDRTFSPWKGSVVDSVVGVFLTQNVADHSSSSAYMDLAAAFPVDWNFNKVSCPEEWGSSVTHEAIMNLDPRNAASRICNSTCVIIEEIDDDEDDADAVCSQESTKSSDGSITSTNQSKMMMLDPFNTVLANAQVGSKMVHTPNTDSLNRLSQGNSAVSFTSTHCELNLNEVPPEVENCDAFTNNVYEDSQVQRIYNHHSEMESNLQAQDQEKNTTTEDMKKKPNKNKKKPFTSGPAKRNSKASVKSFDWDSLRKQAESGGKKRERTERTMDTVDWDALRCTNVNKIAAIIIKRGMNNMLAERIKAFLNRLVLEHGSIDLEWLRDVPPDKTKEYLLSINGLGLKSVECVRLLSLHQIAFPVDTNVGRIAVRLGWVPLQPLPDELQMHLLELYPVLESVQKYLWPRLCKLDQKTLYELHYHMITFGKVFCTKAKPNCNACPIKAECRHYSSAHASARLALPEPEENERTSVMIHERKYKHKPFVVNFRQSLFLSHEKDQEAQRSHYCEPIIEEPTSPELEYTEHDIEDYPWDNNKVLTSTIFGSGTSEDPWENKDIIPTIMLNKEVGISTDLVVLSTQAAAIPKRKLKTKEKLRTEHLVYEIPDYHSILEGFERREAEDIVPYLLAIWTPGETVDSIQPPKQRCDFQENNNTLCHEKKCFHCNKIREEESQIVRGTILIPCRTAMRGGFPLNGTYFQTNEVFADHGTSINPINVPRQLIWNLPNRIAYFGSSVSAICKGLSVDKIQENFQEGYVCVRGFDRESRKPKSIVKRLHCAPSKEEPKPSKREPKATKGQPRRRRKKASTS